MNNFLLTFKHDLTSDKLNYTYKQAVKFMPLLPTTKLILQTIIQFNVIEAICNAQYKRDLLHSIQNISSTM